MGRDSIRQNSLECNRSHSFLSNPAYTRRYVGDDAEVAGVTADMLRPVRKTVADVLGPQVGRELTCRVLRGSEEGAAELLLTQGAKVEIDRMLYRMHTHFAELLYVSSLAHEAGMSNSALHEHFKAATQTSPLQYLEMIHLHKARMLIAGTSGF